MLRTFVRLSHVIADYHYYRRQGYDLKTAWNLASMTIP
jgi:hypothetical protein